MQTLTELSHEPQLVFAGLHEMQKRHVAALISKLLGHGSQTQLVSITDIDYKTIAHGCRDLENSMADCPIGRIRNLVPDDLPRKKTPNIDKKLVAWPMSIAAATRWENGSLSFSVSQMKKESRSTYVIIRPARRNGIQ